MPASSPPAAPIWTPAVVPLVHCLGRELAKEPGQDPGGRPHRQCPDPYGALPEQLGAVPGPCDGGRAGSGGGRPGCGPRRGRRAGRYRARRLQRHRGRTRRRIAASTSCCCAEAGRHAHPQEPPRRPHRPLVLDPSRRRPALAARLVRRRSPGDRHGAAARERGRAARRHPRHRHPLGPGQSLGPAPRTAKQHRPGRRSRGAGRPPRSGPERGGRARPALLGRARPAAPAPRRRPEPAPLALRAALVRDHRPAGLGQDHGAPPVRPALSARSGREAQRRRRHPLLRLVLHRRGRPHRHGRPLHEPGQRPGNRRRGMARLSRPPAQAPGPPAAERRARRPLGQGPARRPRCGRHRPRPRRPLAPGRDREPARHPPAGLPRAHQGRSGRRASPTSSAASASATGRRSGE